MIEVGVSDLSQDFISARQGVQEFLQVAVETNEDIAARNPYAMFADLNLSGIYEPRTFGSAEAILEEYDRLAEAARGTDEPVAAIIHRHSKADSMIVGTTLLGREVDFDTFSEATVGCVPEHVDDAKIESMRRELYDLMHAYNGFKYGVDDEQTFIEKFTIQDPEAIEREVRANLHDIARLIGQYVEVPDEFPEPEFAITPDAVSGGYLTTDEHGVPKFSVNTDPKRKWTPGFGLIQPIHELGGHFVQAELWRSAIASGRIDPALGVTAYASPETTHLEAVAAIAEMIALEGANSEEVRLTAAIELAYSGLQYAVDLRSNRRINSGFSSDEVIAEAQEHLPYQDPDLLRTSVMAGLNEPVYRAYNSMYGVVRNLLIPAFGKIEDPTEKQRFVSTMYNNVLSIVETQQLMASLKKQ